MMVSANNPYRRGAGLYDLNIALPFISAIRRQEARAIADLIGRWAAGAQSALEVGPGTGFYTTMLAQRFREVVAVEESAAMARILGERLAAASIANVTIVTDDFRGLRLDGQFDVAVAIGVLDYIAEPGPFVAKLCAAARRAVIVTAPQRGLWGACFAAGGKLRGITVHRHHRHAPGAWAPGWRCAVTEVGLKTRFTRGLTLIAALQPQETDRARAA